MDEVSSRTTSEKEHSTHTAEMDLIKSEGQEQEQEQEQEQMMQKEELSPRSKKLKTSS